MSAKHLPPLRGSVAGGAARKDAHVYELPNLANPACVNAGLMPDTWHNAGTSAAARADTAAAIAICNTCAGEADCLAWAIEHGVNEGIFGGKTARQRREIAGGRA